MLEFVEAYVKPDGLVPLIGDADDGRVQKLGPQPLDRPSVSAVDRRRAVRPRGLQARRAAGFRKSRSGCSGPDAAAAFDSAERADVAGRSRRRFRDGGFYVLRSERAHVFVDCGEVGMHGRGGHGHNDILSFELWLDGTNLVTDCGAYLYTASREWRNRFRSTAFHNVVQVDDEELNRFLVPDNLWQLQDDARPQDVVWRPGERRRLLSRVALRLPAARSAGRGHARDRAAEGWPRCRRPRFHRRRGSRELTWRFHLDPSVSAEIARRRRPSGGAGDATHGCSSRRRATD